MYIIILKFIIFFLMDACRVHACMHVHTVATHVSTHIKLQLNKRIIIYVYIVTIPNQAFLFQFTVFYYCHMHDQHYIFYNISYHYIEFNEINTLEIHT